MNNEMFAQVKSGKGFIAALDQSGGSTPKTLALYGVTESAYSNEAEMFDRMHEMRSRLIKSPVFNGERVIGAILFEMTMERTIDGMGSAEFLWNKKKVVPFLKVDNGLADEANDVQLMKPIPELGARIAAANKHRGAKRLELVVIQRLDFHHLWYRFQLFRFSFHAVPYVWSHDLVFTLLLKSF